MKLDKKELTLEELQKIESSIDMEDIYKEVSKEVYQNDPN